MKVVVTKPEDRALSWDKHRKEITDSCNFSSDFHKHAMLYAPPTLTLNTNTRKSKVRLN